MNPDKMRTIEGLDGNLYQAPALGYIGTIRDQLHNLLHKKENPIQTVRVASISPTENNDLVENCGAIYFPTGHTTADRVKRTLNYWKDYWEYIEVPKELKIQTNN